MKNVCFAQPLLFSILVMFSLNSFAQSPPSEPPADWGPISSTFEEVPYPYPVQYLDISLFGKDLRLAYMDVQPTANANGQTVILFHGMNFAGLGFTVTIEALADAGFRVVVPDRIGFGRSSKPDIPYNLTMAATNAKALLDHLGVEEVAVLGHSMGGMVASRFGMLYDDFTTHNIFVNQIGMGDFRPGSSGWQDIEEAYRDTLNTSYQSILRNHQMYYPSWKPEYLEWVRLQYGQTLTAEWPRLARIRAWQMSILYNDPVMHDWQYISTKTLVMGGDADRISGDFRTAARRVAESLPNSSLIFYPGVGHNPHFDIPDQYHSDIIAFLTSDPDEPADDSWR